MRPLLPKDFLRKFPKRSVLAGVQRQGMTLAKQPAFVATLVSLGIHGGLALSIPRLLPSSAQDDIAVAIETDVVPLSPTDLAAFSAAATAPAPRTSNPKYTDLNGQTLPNLSALRDRNKTSNSLSSSSSSFGWGTASSGYDWNDRGASDADQDSTSTYDATREDEYYEYWKRSQDVLDRFEEDGGATNGGRGNASGDRDGAGDGGTGATGDNADKKAIAGNNTGNNAGNNAGNGTTGGNTAGTGVDLGAATGSGFNSGASYTAGISARQSYAEWAIAVQDENGLSDEELTPVFIPVSIPVPVTAGSSLIGEQGVAGLLVKPDGTPASANILSPFSSNELAKNLVREFVLSGFSGCNLGTPRETWTACGLDITFVAPNGNRGTTTANAGNTGTGDTNAGNANGAGGSSSNANGNTNGNTNGGRNPGDAGNSGNAGNSAGNPTGQPSPSPNPSTTPSELTALLEGIEPDAPIAIAINEAIPTYREWRTQTITNLGEAAQGLVFRAVPSELPYPADLDPAFDRSLATTAIVSLAINPDLTVVPETATVLRSSGNERLDAIALGFAEATPRDWYANNLELDGSQGAIVLFTLSFVTPEGGSSSPGNPNSNASESENSAEPTTEAPNTADGATPPDSN